MDVPVIVQIDHGSRLSEFRSSDYGYLSPDAEFDDSDSAEISESESQCTSNGWHSRTISLGRAAGLEVRRTTLYIIRITGILKPVLGHEKAEASVGAVRARLKKLNACATRSDWSDVHAEIPSRILGTPPVSQPPSLRYLLVAYLRLLRVGNSFLFFLSSVLLKPTNKIRATPTRRRKREQDVKVG